MNISDPYLVLGMHRSGTSYLAGLLQAMGVSMGDELVEANEGNPRGHFEDKAILEIHKEWLAANQEPGHAFDDGMMRQSPMLTREGFDEEKWHAFLEKKNGVKLWGWKEPRSCLFLTHWLKVFPGMKGLVVFRHPLEVNASMLRRGHWDYAIFPFQVYRAYALYNRNILSLLEKKADSFLCLNANKAFQNHEDLVSRIEAKFPQLSMKRDTHPFYAKEFRSLSITRGIHDCCRYLFPDAIQVFEELNKIADVPFVFAEPRDDEALFVEFAHTLAKYEKFMKNDRMFRVGLIYQFESLFWKFRYPELNGSYELIQEKVSREIRSLRKMGVEWKQMSVCIEEMKAYVADLEKNRDELWQKLVTLGDSWENQKKHIKKISEQRDHFWADLVKVGKSWEEKEARILELEALLKKSESHCEALQRDLEALKEGGQ